MTAEYGDGGITVGFLSIIAFMLCGGVLRAMGVLPVYVLVVSASGFGIAFMVLIHCADHDRKIREGKALKRKRKEDGDKKYEHKDAW